MIDPLYLFVFLGLFSPGPNVVMLTASGARFGFARTLPHLAGVVLGVGVTAGVTGFGIGATLSALPALETVLKVIAALWILVLAWMLWRSAASQGPEAGRPMTFPEAMLFQWVNPKIWSIALAASAGYTDGLAPVQAAGTLAFAFSGINLGVCLFWTAAGSALRLLLQRPRAWQIFARAMAIALAASAAMVFL